MQNIINEDMQLVFADWGRMAFLEEIENYYDPDTGMLEESIITSPLLVLASPVEDQPNASTTATTSKVEQLFIIRESDFPENVNFTTARIVLDGRSFSVAELTSSHIPASIALLCRRLE